MIHVSKSKSMRAVMRGQLVCCLYVVCAYSCVCVLWEWEWECNNAHTRARRAA